MPNGKARHSDARRRKDGASHRPSVAAKPNLREIGIRLDSRDRFVSALHTTPGFFDVLELGRRQHAPCLTGRCRLYPGSSGSSPHPTFRLKYYEAGDPPAAHNWSTCPEGRTLSPAWIIAFSPHLPSSLLPSQRSGFTVSCICARRRSHYVGLVSMYARAPVAAMELWVLILREVLHRLSGRVCRVNLLQAHACSCPRSRATEPFYSSTAIHTPLGTMTRGNFVESVVGSTCYVVGVSMSDNDLVL
ncbi:hypothetical protein DFH08DRAFT_882811 [Mycena albidolilacea]|uniref:Uncharacterized protein n=1 Tax=Mycena albidolilacea TaxID=1033008 RepID=A0AAD7EJ55_9AGAR|nr:hypothetical protein DFH08DRAFT_882811 [Mycena albidolilacea]